jgi:probable rRNA maturation factor
MALNNTCHIVNLSKSKPPRLPFLSIKNSILDEDYELEVVFGSKSFQKKLNKTYRNIDDTTNILSFPLSNTSGLITFDINKIKKETNIFEMPYPKLLMFLFIHGCLHLKGFKHSSKMEKEEKRIINKFS